MSNRFWFYLAAAVIIIGLYSWRIAEVNAINNEVARIEQSAKQERVDTLKNYAAKQTDARKLVSLVKLLKKSDPQSLQVLIDRAYELNPDSRDITLLASEFHPELKSKILELDPLYKP